MSYSLALAGSVPNPIPTANTPEVQSMTVGSYRLGVGYAVWPWLDAMLSVRNVSAEQSALAARDNVRETLTAAGNAVDDVSWVPGGFIHARWRPNGEQPAVAYATSTRDALLRGAQRLSPQSQIFFNRLRVNMPAGRTDLYVYPTGTVPPPPPGPSIGVSSQGAPPSEDASGGASTALVVAGVVGGTALAAGLGFFFYQRRRQMSSNTRRRRARRSKR